MSNWRVAFLKQDTLGGTFEVVILAVLQRPKEGREGRSRNPECNRYQIEIAPHSAVSRRANTTRVDLPQGDGRAASARH